MYLVYLLPLFLIVLVALAIFAGPLIAVLLVLLFLIALGGYKFFGPGTEPEHAPRDRAGAGEEETGMWGERRPS